MGVAENWACAVVCMGICLQIQCGITRAYEMLTQIFYALICQFSCGRYEELLLHVLVQVLSKDFLEKMVKTVLNID
jgi:hypothetical protein